MVVNIKDLTPLTHALFMVDEQNQRAKYGIEVPAASRVLRDGRQAVLADHSTDGTESIRDREGGEPRSKGPTEGKERPGITFYRKELQERLRAHKLYQRSAGGFTMQGQQQLCAERGSAPVWFASG